MLTVKIVFFMCVFGKLSAQHRDHMNEQDKRKLISLSKELTADAKHKIRQADAIKEEHSRIITYEIGFVIGQVREKYKMMMELYRIALNRFTGRAFFEAPHINKYRNIHYYNKMEYIHLLEKDIDKLVHVLEQLPESMVKLVPTQFRAAGSSEEEAKRIALEEEVKSRYRQQFLQRKLGSGNNSTTGKRFLDKWPVEKTWSLETY